MLRNGLENGAIRQPDLFLLQHRGPVVIPRSNHCVSRKDMDREALKVLYRLKDHGHLAYLVGGSVRDLLLGRRPKDFDVGTDATPGQVRRIFRHSRIIGKRFRLVHVYFRGRKIIEVSTFRRRIEFDDREAARLGLSEGEIYGTPQEDAFRRDLTINGLFYNIADFSIIDYVGGMEDLKRGIIRTIGDPFLRFLRDPVRMMRAVRHAARTGFTIEGRTWEAMEQHRSLIRLCSVHRVRDEWLKDLRSGRSREWALLALDAGLLQEIFPAYWRGLDGERCRRVQRLLAGLLGGLDRLVARGREPEEPLLISMLVLPRLMVEERWLSLRGPKIKWPTHEARELLMEFLAPFDFRRAVQDSAAQILASQWPIALCHARGSWPKRVVNKPTFEDALELFELVQGVERGGEEVGLGEGVGASSSRKRRRRRRRRRKKREKVSDEAATERPGAGVAEL